MYYVILNHASIFGVAKQTLAAAALSCSRSRHQPSLGLEWPAPRRFIGAVQSRGRCCIDAVAVV